MTPPRNQIAKLRRLMDAGLLTLPMLREIEITHQEFCPARNPRTLDCICDPAIWFRDALMTFGRLAVARA